ncbi:MAG: hypothetical protein HONDAALG_00909 [Gammaproteobacteria bacterium]|nr:hypothetical protein [Gammaproteobacteria bacterium]
MAWPAVKRRVWNEIRRQHEGAAGPVTAAPGKVAVRFVTGLVAIVRHVVLPARRTVAVLYSPRQSRLADGTMVHPHLDALVRPERSVLHCAYGWGGSRTSIGRGYVAEHGIAAVVAIAARVLAGSPSIRGAAAKLGQSIAAMFPEAAAAVGCDVIADQLARFRVRKWLYGLLFARSGVRAVAVTDAGGKTGEIAAARSLGLPVVEVQHGMFGHDEPDYAWVQAHRGSGRALPLPDAIIVFGPLWKRELARNDYWRDQEILLANSPVLTSYRRSEPVRRPERESRLTVLFATQWYVRSDAIAFLGAALDLQRRGGSRLFQLRIKLHPAEQAAERDYAALAETFPEDCVLAPASTEAFAEILQADLVTGFTSMMLLEAIGLGVPALSIATGAGKEGFCTAFGIDELRDVVPEVDTPEKFIEHLRAMSRPDALRAARAAAGSAAAAIYTLDGRTVEQAFVDATGVRP